MLPIAFHPIYQHPLPEGHRFPMLKYELLPQQLLHEGTAVHSDFFEPSKLCDDRDILRVHTYQYFQELKDLSLDKRAARKLGFPLSEQLVKRELRIAQGTIEACLKAFDHRIAMNIAGGTHHAYTDHGEAFCLLNDQAIAARYLQHHGLAEKILIVDLDVHQGNGTAAIFESNPKVFTLSVHGAKNYPFRKEKSDMDIALEDDTGDKKYLDKIKKIIPALIDNIKPEFIFDLSGVDVLKTDKLGRLSLTIEGCKERDLFVLKQCNDRNIPLHCSMGGGYCEDIKVIIEAHANTYRAAKLIYT